MTLTAKDDLARLLEIGPPVNMHITDLIPTAINDEVYRPVTEDDPAVLQLAADVDRHGLLDPIIVTTDNVIVSGHRRRMACLIAGLDTVPVRRANIHSNAPQFIDLLVSYNLKREKTHESGRENLIVIVVSDFDPEGEDIPESFARSMRDDFGIPSVKCVKAALTHDQVQSHDLPSSLEAKKSSSRYRRFADQYGTRAVELEALPPETLQELTNDAIDSVLDIAAFNAELRAEKQDAAFLQDTRIKFKQRLMAGM